MDGKNIKHTGAHVDSKPETNKERDEITKEKHSEMDVPAISFSDSARELNIL